jgi:hypothetical protein
MGTKRKRAVDRQKKSRRQQMLNTSSQTLHTRDTAIGSGKIEKD